MGSSEISHAEEPEMPPEMSEENERASERELEDPATEAASDVVAPFEDDDPTSSSANDSSAIEPGNSNADAALAKPKRANKKPRARSRSGIEPNNVRKLRQEAMMSKAELARRAGVSPLTIDRVEAGCPCRMDTKRKILEALGLKPSARTEVWPDIDDST